MNGSAAARTLASSPRILPRLLRWTLGASAGLVALFHARLLLQRLTDASIAEPEVLLRWLGACGLLAGVAWLRPRGLSLTHGRPALIFWLLVLLLHVGASPVVVSATRAEELLLVLPLGVAAAGGALALAERRPRRRPAPPVGPSPRPRSALVPPPRRSAGAAPDRFSPRPPPFASAA